MYTSRVPIRHTLRATPRLTLTHHARHLSLLRRAVFAAQRPIPTWPASQKQITTLQEANPRDLPEIWFNTTYSPGSCGQVLSLGANPPEAPKDERKVKLGKTLRILQTRLPSLLQSPLPSDILAPNISLHLFPSTHPFLPTVSGRVAYIAALWTSPIAWNRLPLIGDVKLEILSERVVNHPINLIPQRQGAVGEQLVVRWRTSGKGVIDWRWPLQLVGNGDKTQKPKHFTGLFVFEFDKEGKVLSHTIEHAQAGGDWERGVGAKFVGLTDWLLGSIKGRGQTCPVYERHEAPPLPRRRY